MTRPLPPRTRDTLVAIHALTEPRGPTVRELCDALGVSSTCTAQRHIERLQARGLVTVPKRGKSRGVVLTLEGELEIRRLREEA
jgi:Mn-dependent DtxR family transcriptional regulator